MRLKALLILLTLVSLVGCSSFSAGSPTPLPTVVLDSGTPGSTPRDSGGRTGGGVTASGIVVPDQEANLVFRSAGRVEAVNAAVGDAVEAGQVLVQLEGQEDLEAAVSTAQFELAQAEQAIEDLKTAGESARVQAMQDIVTYEQAVKSAQYTLDNFLVPTEQMNVDAVAALNQMKQRLDRARADFEPYKYRPSSDATREDRKEALDDAQAAYNTAVRRLQYEYELEVANTKLAKAQKDYATLSAGPDPDQLRLAEARRANAQNQLAAAQAALERLTLTAPFGGTISQLNVHPGEWVIAGQPVLVLADLSNLRVETTDLSERDVPRVAPGQAVSVTIKALSQDVNGEVLRIAPLAETLGGDVVYKTTIELDELPPGLRAGMSVEVQFRTET